MQEDQEIKSILQEIQSNQIALHDDMSAVADNLRKLDTSFTEFVDSSSVPNSIEAKELYKVVRALVVEVGTCDTSLLQRVLRIGYSQASRLIDSLKENNVISDSGPSNSYDVLLDKKGLQEIEKNEEYQEKNNYLDLDDYGEDLYEEAKTEVIETGKCSASHLQRRLRIGYNRALLLQSKLAERGVIDITIVNGPEKDFKSHQADD